MDWEEAKGHADQVRKLGIQVILPNATYTS